MHHKESVLSSAATLTIWWRPGQVRIPYSWPCKQGLREACTLCVYIYLSLEGPRRDLKLGSCYSLQPIHLPNVCLVFIKGFEVASCG